MDLERGECIQQTTNCRAFECLVNTDSGHLVSVPRVGRSLPGCPRPQGRVPASLKCLMDTLRLASGLLHLQASQLPYDHHVLSAGAVTFKWAAVKGYCPRNKAMCLCSPQLQPLGADFRCDFPREVHSQKGCLCDLFGEVLITIAFTLHTM